MSLDDHQLDDGGTHDPDDCEVCVEGVQTRNCVCRCGVCCEQLLIEASLRDAVREPRIAAECQALRDFVEPIGYLLNDAANGGACRFFDRTTRLCTIHETRPLVCRVFNCDQERADPDSPVFDEDGLPVAELHEPRDNPTRPALS
ncbi:MAG: YkgJ family cysteine cluster protein [Planctomycetaceae bacterium]|nr:YkgJ family cysteine cluster protein [Planctomycetaceae bacterium]